MRRCALAAGAWLSAAVLPAHAAAPAAPALLGRTAAAHEISVALVLPSRDPAGAEAFVAHVSNPADPLFHQYLAPADYARKFGASPQDYAAALQWARSRGLTVGEQFTGNHVLVLHGPAARIEQAFSVTLQDFRGADGQVFHAPSNEPVLPAALAGRMSVIGLSDQHKFAPNVILRPPGAAASPRVAKFKPFGYSAANLRQAYTVQAQSIGKHTETVAVFEQGGYVYSDVATYISANGLLPRPVNLRGVNGYRGAVDDPGVELESVLDIDMLLAMNPVIKQVLVYEDGDDPYQVALIASLAAMATDKRADIISVSYGIPELVYYSGGAAALNAESIVLTQLAAQGQTVIASAGDGGAYCQPIGGDGSYCVEDMAGQPKVLSVGGTTLFTTPQGDYDSEEAWNDLASGLGATGGGVSAHWKIPGYQQTKPNNYLTTINGGSATMRNVPDVAAVANAATGVAVYSALNGGWVVVGGTSVAAPIWAGILSVANSNSKGLGFGAIGFYNPGLYQIAEARRSRNVLDFADVVTGENGSPALFGNTGFVAGLDYDNTTGFGSPLGLAVNLDTALLATDPNNHKAPPAPRGLLGGVTSTSLRLSWIPQTGVNGFYAEVVDAITGDIAGNVFLNAQGSFTRFNGLVPGRVYEALVISISPGGVTASAPVFVTTPKG
jgi:kumamolisin